MDDPRQKNSPVAEAAASHSPLEPAVPLLCDAMPWPLPCRPLGLAGHATRA